MVSVALQLPEFEAKAVPNGRLTDKFPSTTTLWLILRKLESGANGGVGHSRNFTARGVARAAVDESAGRLYYETPVLQVMGRELSSFTDLQKTLGQLGFNSGSVLLRLSFRPTETPLEEAMAEIEQYFKSVEIPEPSAGAHAASVANLESTPDTQETAIPEDVADSRTPPEAIEASSSVPSTTEPTPNPIGGEERKAESHQHEQLPPELIESTIVGPDHRPISVFSPPTRTTPHAALQQYNESDYEPTIDHARLHQSRLSTSARNKRLPSEAELAASQQASAEKLAQVSDVEIKVRFPDQSQVVAKFTNLDTAASLYAFVRGMVVSENEGFVLSFPSTSGGRPKIVPKEPGRERLIGDLGMRGRVLVSFSWEEGVDADVRSGPVLKELFREKAREIEVKDVGVSDVGNDDQMRKGKGEMEKEVGGGKDGGSGSRSGKKGGVPKWLKLPGKK